MEAGNPLHGIVRILGERATRSSRYLLCRPEGGLADIFNQIWLCCQYARQHDRVVLIDTAVTDFGDDFFRYFRSRTPLVQPLAAIGNQIDSLTVHPPQLASIGLGYQRVRVVTTEAPRGYFAPIAHPEIALTLDFTRTYDEDLIVHHACGGGPRAGDALRLFAPNPPIVDEFDRRRRLLPAGYCGLHVRNTDLTSDYLPYMREHLADVAQYPAVFLTSDDLATVREIQANFSPPLMLRSFSCNISDDGTAVHHKREVDRYPINLDAIADLLLLAASSRIFSPFTANGEYSGFTRFALSLQESGYPATLAPLVSCLMVTRGKLFPGRYAIECFLRQTYTERELVVVIDSPAPELKAHLRALDDRRIRLIELPAGKRTLGELRNISVASARGEFVCQWDDDDLYAPERIQTQLDALVAHAAGGCALRRWTLWWPAARRLAISGAREWEGTILAAKVAMPDYPALRRCEDTEMMEAFVRRNRLVSLDAPELYVYIHHGNNTFNARHFHVIYNFSRRRWVGASYQDELSKLAAKLPVRDYDAELSGTAGPGAGEIGGDARAQPLVSIVVRSMGRAELRLALESLAAQDYPALDIIVVDATGGSHPPLPEIVLRPGHTIRRVGGGERLLRPHAANVGLEAVRGEWFGFLDDDDTCDPEFVADLIRASVKHPDALVIYGPARMLDEHKEVVRLFGIGFNRSVMYFGPLFYWQASLIRRSVIENGCRFDERLQVCEDRDFLAQIAELGEFAFVQSINFNYRPDLGTSGTGQGANRDTTRLMRYDQLLQAKWSGSGVYHTQRSLRLCRRGMRAYAQGRPTEAKMWFERALDQYPDDPNALNGLGYLCLQGGESDEAETLLRRAVEINPTAGEYRINLAAALESAGRHWAAREQARAATADPSVRESAQELLARLGCRPPSRESPARPGPQSSEPIRTAPCPCGSGKRYKHCCGSMASRAVAANSVESAAQSAIAAFQAGDAFAAADVVAGISPPALTSAATALACGEICQEMRRYEEAYGFYREAARLDERAKASEAVARCGHFWYKDERDASMLRTLRMQISRFNERSAHSPVSVAGAGAVHIVGALGQLGGSELQAIGLYEALATSVPIRLWSTEPPLPAYSGRCPIELIDAVKGHFPPGGHLIFIGTGRDYGDWLDQATPTRVTICFNTDLLESLIERLVQIEDFPEGFSLELTYPSGRFRDALGLPGVVEYPLVDTDRFRPSRMRSDPRDSLVVGRHSRDDRRKFHPNDPAFLRRLVREGHRVRIVGGTCLAPALGPALVNGEITLLPERAGGIVEFLDGLDCFFFRVHPHSSEACGTVVMEAMSMALPVVVFGERIGAAELIQNGRNGYAVDTEEQALECIRRLAKDPEHCLALGAAARATMIAVMQQQVRSLRQHYGAGAQAVAMA